MGNKLVGWFSILTALLTLSIMGCQPKGRIIGNAKVITPTINTGLGKKFDVPAGPLNMNNENVYLLKYDEKLQQNCELVHEEYRRNTTRRIMETITKAEAFYGANKMELFKATVNDAGKEAEERNNELGRKIYNLIFPNILQKASIDNTGNFEFRDIPYGRYFIHVRHIGYVWLIPISLQNMETKVTIEESNHYPNDFSLK